MASPDHADVGSAPDSPDAAEPGPAAPSSPEEAVPAEVGGPAGGEAEEGAAAEEPASGDASLLEHGSEEEDGIAGEDAADLAGLDGVDLDDMDDDEEEGVELGGMGNPLSGGRAFMPGSIRPGPHAARAIAIGSPMAAGARKPVAIWTEPAAAARQVFESLTHSRTLPPGAVSWAAGPEAEGSGARPDAGMGGMRAGMGYRMQGSRFPDTDLPGRHRASGEPARPYTGAWGDVTPPRSAREAKEVLGLEVQEEELAAEAEEDAAGAEEDAAGAEARAEADAEAAGGAAAQPSWLSGPGRRRVDALADIIVQPAGSRLADDAAEVMRDVIGRVFGDDGAQDDAHPHPRLLAHARGQIGRPASPRPGPPADTLSPRPSLGILRERGGAPESFPHDSVMASQVASLNLALILVRDRGPGRLLLDAAPRELTASLLRVFHPAAAGSFHHACSVLQRLVLVHPEDVAEALVSQGPAPLRRLMAFLHHPPVADTLVQLLTLSHSATAQGGAGLIAGPGPPQMAMFGAPPSDDELGALFKARPPPSAGVAISRGQARLHRAIGEWHILPELARHMTTYGVDGAAWGPPGLFPDDAAASAAAPAAPEAAPGPSAAAAAAASASRPGRTMSVSEASESERALEDTVRDGDEGDDPVAEAAARGAGEEGQRQAAEAAHVAAASDALVQCVRALREQGESAAEALSPLVREPTVRGLVEAACGSSLAPVLADAPSGASADDDDAPAKVDASAESGAGGKAAAGAAPANPRVRPLRAGECSGATARSAASVRALSALAALAFDEHLPDQGPAPMGAARVLRLNPFHASAPQLTATLITALPRLAGHLACVHECLHPGKAKKILRKPKKSKKGPAPGTPAASLPVLPGDCPETSHPGRYSVGVPFGVYRLDAAKLLASLVERAPEPSLSHLAGELAQRGCDAHMDGVARLRAEATAAARATAETPPSEDAEAAAGAEGADDDAAAAAAPSVPVEPPAALGGWRGPGVWGALVSWAVLYPHSDSFHRTLERLVRSALLANHPASIRLLLTDCRLVDNLTKASLDLATAADGATASPTKASAASGPPRTPLRALSLRLLAMLRLSAQAEHRDGNPTVLRDLLATKQAWTDRLGKIRAELRAQREDRMPRPPRPGMHSLDGIPPAVAAMIAAMQARDAPPPEQLAREREERESIDLGGIMARELGFGELERDPAYEEEEEEEEEEAEEAGKADAEGGSVDANAEGTAAGLARESSAEVPAPDAAAAPVSPPKRPMSNVSTSPMGTGPAAPGPEAAPAAAAPPSLPPPSRPPSAPTAPVLPSGTPARGPEEDSDAESVESAAAAHAEADQAAEDAEEGHSAGPGADADA